MSAVIDSRGDGISDELFQEFKDKTREFNPSWQVMSKANLIKMAHHRMGARETDTAAVQAFLAQFV